MNKCIYLKETETTQTFDKQEHIFPAGIGGINKLPKGYVSDKVNGIIFSKLELEFMRKSLIALCRGMEGPGKRGSLSKSKETKSPIYISNNAMDGESKLSYLRKGKPYSINQVKISLTNNKANLIIGNTEKNSYEESLKKFVFDLEEFEKANFNNMKYTFLKDENIEDDHIIIGEFESKWYLATNYKNKDTDYTEVRIRLKKLIDSAKKKTVEEGIKSSSQIIMYPKFNFDSNHFYRICVKTAFNYLASRIGQIEVLKDQFDDLRRFVLGDSEEFDVGLMGRGTLFKRFELPERCHSISITKMDGKLVAIVSLYGEAYNIGMTLCENYCGNINMLIGICDWKNKHEYNLR